MTAPDPTARPGSPSRPDATGPRLRVLVVDDHALVRAGVRAEIEATAPDLEVVAIRGNVPTRLARVVGTVGGDGPMGASREPDLDGVVLALSGLRRLGLESYASEVLKAVPQGAGTERVSPAGASGTAAPVMVPAASQGALAVETRADLAETDPVLAGALAALDDPAAHAAARAERALMRRLEAGCAAPVGAIATPVGDGEALRLDAVVAALDGRTLLRRDATASVVEPEDLGIAVAEALLADGAAELVDLHATKEKPVHEAPRKNPTEPDGEPAAAASQEAAAAADATAGEPATASAATGRARAPRDAHALDPAQSSRYTFSLLRVFGSNTPQAEIDAAEKHYKDALMTRRVGLNRN